MGFAMENLSQANVWICDDQRACAEIVLCRDAVKLRSWRLFLAELVIKLPPIWLRGFNKTTRGSQTAIAGRFE